MNKTTPLMLTVFAVSLWLVTASAKAATIASTTLSFSSVTYAAPFNITFDGLVIDWSTPVMAGVIDETDLTSLTYTLTDQMEGLLFIRTR